MGYKIGHKTKQFCKLVCFVQSEIERTLTPNALDEKNIAKDISNRFVDCFGLKEVPLLVSFPFCNGKKLMDLKIKYGNYIQQNASGGWEFGINDPEPMSIEVLNNGEMFLDYPSAEDLFNIAIE